MLSIILQTKMGRYMHAAFDILELNQELLEFEQPVDIGFQLVAALHLVELYGMQLDVGPGRYVVAVSGGVDSVVLLDMLQGRPGLELVVAHYDHGIRLDSAQDRELVQLLAKRYRLPFVYEEGKLGSAASEAEARRARYRFLERVRHERAATAVITAHQQDDVMETALVNILRGTGRKGLTSLANSPHLMRPLLSIPKRQILAYAREHNLDWREDSTNTNERYLRNYIRRRLLPRFGTADRAQLLGIIGEMRLLNRHLDEQLAALLQEQSAAPDLDRSWFIQLPHAVAKEVLAAWLRAHGVRNFDTKTLERLTVAMKTLQPGRLVDVVNGVAIKIGRQSLALSRLER
jgi:tRNA(Ile)-lysidine synthetase-like protein